MSPDPRRNRTGLFVLVLVALVLLTLDYRQGDDGIIGTVQRGAVTVFAPVLDGFAVVVRPVGNVFGALGELGSLRAEKAALESELDRLRDRRVSVADLQRENAELRAQMDMRERLSLTTTGAQVIAQAANVLDNTVLIDAGADAGVEVGQAVINPDGLVGKVAAVTRSHARVQLLTSPEATYAARLAPSGEEGLLSGRGARPFQLEIFEPDAEVSSGDEVVTHAFQGSSVPDGLPVGEVVGRLDVGSSPRFLAVSPYADFTRITSVQVVLDAPEHPDGLDEDELVDPPVPEPPPAPEQETDPDEPDPEGADPDEAEAGGPGQEP